jgi:integrase
LREGNFLSAPELARIASLSQMRMTDVDADQDKNHKSNVIKISRIGIRLRPKLETPKPVDTSTQASRLRYIANYLTFVSNYMSEELSFEKRSFFEEKSERALNSFRAHIPAVSKRAKLDARVGLSFDDQFKLIAATRPDSSTNPWQRDFVRQRNWLILLLLLATGMRRGELLGLQIKDVHPNERKIKILRRADATEDARRIQPNTKTHDREIELHPTIAKLLSDFINGERRKILAARKIPQIFVSDDGQALSTSSLDKIFRQLRNACPGLPIRLTSHVMRHTWNERFSEAADSLGFSEVAEQYARNQQQGWSENSKMSATYTRRHISLKGNQVSLKIQKDLDEALQRKK